MVLCHTFLLTLLILAQQQAPWTVHAKLSIFLLGDR